jgi:hypothetical protein
VTQPPLVSSPPARIVAPLLTLVILAGCDGGKPGRAAVADRYGDPIGIQIEAHGAVPALSVAVAVTKGRDPTPFVGPLASAVHGAATGCPAFVAAIAAGKTARIELGARNNVLESLGAAPDEVGGACMTSALAGKPVTMDRPDPLDVIVELRSGAADASHQP